ncbi:MAG: site-specific integrase [Cytophagales bacterium]|nr:site-specific integrase [Cytophagales bacterium]
MATYNFYLRDKISVKPTPIVLYVHYCNNRIKIPTGEKIEPKYWDFKNQEVRRSKILPNHPEFNTRLRKLKALAEDILRIYLNDNDQQYPSRENYRNLLKETLNPGLKKEFDSKPTLIQFIETYLSECETKLNPQTGKPLKINTIRVYRQAYRQLLEFVDLNFKNKPFNYQNIDYYFYVKFQEFLIKEKNFSTNTVGKHIRTLKTFFLEANSRGYMENFSAEKFKGVSEKTDSIYLNTKEIETLFNLELSNNKRLEKVRDLFIVGCWTGLRFSDFTKISENNIKSGFITLLTQKTKVEVVIPIHSQVVSIMERYKGVTNNSLPLPMSNQKMNEYLKELGKMAKIDEENTISYTKGGKMVIVTKKKYELMQSHTCRRSFATNQYLAGFPSHSIMQITGHKTEKAFLKYLKITPTEHAKKLQKFWLEKNVA